MSLSEGVGWSRLRTLLKVALLIVLLIAANYLAHELADALNIQIRPSNEDAVHRTIMTSAALYVLLLATPFVPGAEVGLALIAMLGPPIAFLVYVCTVAGLALSFAVGRLIPLTGLIRLAEDFNFQRMAKMLNVIEPMNRQDRLAFLASKAPIRFRPVLLRYRHLALAVALNVPGNFLIGGGGGIALLAGISRLYSVPGFIATIAIAVAPVPLTVLFFGNEFLAK